MNISTKVLFIIFICFIILSNGCATLFKGVNERIDIISDPSAAKVYINGGMIGKSPIQVKLQSNKTHQVEFVKEGYDKKTIILSGNVEAGWIVLDFLAGVFPIIIDAATGSWYSFENNYIHAVLEKQNNEIQPISKSIADTSESTQKEYTSLLEFELTSKETIFIFNGKVSVQYIRGYNRKSTVSFKGIFGVAKYLSGPYNDTSIQIDEGDTYYLQLTVDIFYTVEVKREKLGNMTLVLTRI
jgi:hypothetical protein